MSDVSFNEETPIAPIAAGGSGGMTAWIIRNKFAKDEKGASYLLIGVAAVAIVLAVSLVLLSGGDTTIDAGERARLEQSTPIIQP